MATVRGPGHGFAFEDGRLTAGERSVVLHEKPTDPTGAAGARLPCLPVTLA